MKTGKPVKAGKGVHGVFLNDPATLVLLGRYHAQANPQDNSIASIDTLIEIATNFQQKHYKTDWENSKADWADTLAMFYNKNKPAGWDRIPMHNDKQPG